MTEHIQGPTAIVTGASRGIGRAISVELAGACPKALDSLLPRLETVDVLVNNAGIAADQLFVMMPANDWDAVINTTLRGFYNVTKPVLEKMIPQKRGAVVSIASVAGLMGNRGQANYAAAKAGLIGASRAVAAEVARVVRFLCSEDASCVTGQVISVNGGMV